MHSDFENASSQRIYLVIRRDGIKELGSTLISVFSNVSNTSIYSGNFPNVFEMILKMELHWVLISFSCLNKDEAQSETHH